MKILIACEESQIITKAFRRRGHDAFSCDLKPCSGGHPEWHIQDNALNHFNDGWDMMIAHPVCKRLANSGVQWLAKRNLWDDMIKGVLFFRKFLNADIPKIVIENPILHGYALRAIGKKYSQIVQPWMFGHTERKATCLWIKGLPLLTPTNNVKEEMLKLPKREQQRIFYMPPSKDREMLRSKTYPGIADAMAKQWG